MVDSSVKAKMKFRIFLLGGLGNQLFGVFFGHALNIAFPGKVALSDRLIPFGSNSTRMLMVNQVPEARLQELNLIQSTNFLNKLIRNSRIGRSVVWKLYEVSSRRKRMNIEDFWNLDYPLESGIDILDYCDDWFFPEYVRRVKGITSSLSDLRALEDYQNYISNGIICHVRVGDYLKHPEIYDLINEEYYFSAIREISKKNQKSSQLILIITEDVQEVQRFYPNLAKISKIILGKSDLSSDVHAFKIMQNAMNLVAANSTFSMWAAWFGLHARERTFVPSVLVGEIPQSGLRELQWELINPTSGEIVENEEFDSWFKQKQIRFHEILSVIQEKSLKER
jgi:Glycosyl transferase family 11